MLSALDRLRLRGERFPQATVQHGEDRALRHGDGAVDQELEERHLNGQRRAGQCKHGLCALQPDRDDDAVQRHGNRCRQQQGTQDDREVPAQQQKKSTEDAPADAAKAFLIDCHRLLRSSTNSGSTSTQLTQRNSRAAPAAR